MDFAFDELGNIQPSQILGIGWGDFRNGFVEKTPQSPTRLRLFQNLEKLVEQVVREICPEFEIWIDGSFVSTKPEPADIDAVFWIPIGFAQHKKPVLDNLIFTKSTKTQLSLDLYYAIEYPIDHKRHFLTHLDRLYWRDIYGKTRPDKNGVQRHKGFFKIKIGPSWKTS